MNDTAVPIHRDRRLDWVPRFDERSRDYGIRSAVAPTRIRSKRWTPGPILDQGSEGACVGFAATAEALATPVLVTKIPREPDAFAHGVYRNAQRIDQWEGENYEGTSVLAGMKVMRNLGLIREYRWAFGVNDVVIGLINSGPVVLGTYWYDGMYEAPFGVLHPEGAVVGGHAYLLTAYNHSSTNPLLIGQRTVTVQNSWGRGWGQGGLAEMTLEDLGTLLDNDGEAAVPFRRSYGRG
jgi:hypothetical protein